MMYQKKEKLYIRDLVPDPAISYPGYYILSASMAKNELLHTALIALHTLEFTFYQTPKSFDDLFAMLQSGLFPIYKERYIVGYFGGKMMYLESHGWKALPATEPLFQLENWLVC